MSFISASAVPHFGACEEAHTVNTRIIHVTPMERNDLLVFFASKEATRTTSSASFRGRTAEHGGTKVKEQEHAARRGSVRAGRQNMVGRRSRNRGMQQGFSKGRTAEHGGTKVKE